MPYERSARPSEPNQPRASTKPWAFHDLRLAVSWFAVLASTDAAGGR